MISHQLGRPIPLSHPFTQESNNHFGHKMSHFNSLFFLFFFLVDIHSPGLYFCCPQAIISTGDSDKYVASSLQLNSWFYSFVLRWLIATVREMKIYWFLFSTESVFYFSDMTYYITWSKIKVIFQSSYPRFMTVWNRKVGIKPFSKINPLRFCKNTTQLFVRSPVVLFVCFPGVTTHCACIFTAR